METARKVLVNAMISYRIIMLVVGLICAFILAIIAGIITLSRGGLAVIPFLAVLAYFAFALKQVYDEWKI